MYAVQILANKRVAIAIDGSEESNRALEFSLRLVRPFKPRVLVLTVVPTMPEFSRHPDLAEALLKRLREDGKNCLFNAQAVVKSNGLEVETLLLEGYPADEICGFVERETLDLLILGNRGRSNQCIHLMGSVSYNVVQFAKASVLVVRNDRPIKKILLPVDGSEPAIRAAEWTAQIAKSQNASVAVLYVIPQKTEEVKFSVTKGVGEPFLGPLTDKLSNLGITVAKRVEYGHPAESIVRVAKKNDFDLIVLGEQGKSSSKVFALGSVTDKVLHYAPCSILVVQ